MGPVLEDGSFAALGVVQIRRAVSRNAGPQDVVVGALDDVDGVDLHIAEMLDGRARGLGAGAEGGGRIEALRVQPEAAGAGNADFERGDVAGHGHSSDRMRRRLSSAERAAGGGSRPRRREARR